MASGCADVIYSGAGLRMTRFSTALVMGFAMPRPAVTRFVTRGSRSRAGSRDPASSLRAPAMAGPPFRARHACFVTFHGASRSTARPA